MPVLKLLLEPIITGIHARHAGDAALAAATGEDVVNFMIEVEDHLSQLVFQIIIPCSLEPPSLYEFVVIAHQLLILTLLLHPHFF